MTVEERLKAFILTRYPNVKAFSKAAGISNTTFASILKRGIENSGVQRILYICRFLKIDADKLVDNGEIVPITELRTPSGLALTAEEEDIIVKYRALDEQAQRRVRRNLNAEYEDATASLGEDFQHATGHG